MRKHFYFLIFLCFFGIYPLDSFSAKEGTLTIYDLGQGGSVIAKSSGIKGKVGVMVDAGSSTATFSANKNKKNSGTAKSFTLISHEETRPVGSALDSAKKEQADDDLPEELADDEEEESHSTDESSLRRGQKEAAMIANTEGSAATLGSVGISTSSLKKDQTDRDLTQALAAEEDVLHVAAASLRREEEEAEMTAGREEDAAKGVLALSRAASGDSSETQSSIDDTTDEQRRARKALRQPVTDQYESAAIKRIQDDLFDVNKILVFITHPDKDHYNELPNIFNKSFMAASQGKEMTFVMTGFRDQYTESRADPSSEAKPKAKERAQDWIVRMSSLPNVKFLFTGTTDGQKDSTGSPYQQVQPPFRSVDGTTSTPLEMSLQKLIKDTQDEYGLKLDILSMNSAMKDIGDVERAKAADKNQNSMILRIGFMEEDGATEIPGTSILLPGDAEEETWMHAMEPYRAKEVDSAAETTAAAASAVAAPPAAEATAASVMPSKLTVHNMLLSHHGSPTNGSTSLPILEHFNPQVIFMSNGRYIQYKHPDRDVTDTIQTYLQKNSLATEKHELSYYGRSERQFQRTWTNFPIFSTLNNGTMTLDVANPNQVNVSRSKLPSPQ